MSDYYQILGLTSTASELEIKRAYRRLAHRFHPDKNSSPEAAQRFNEINEAYTNLINSDSHNVEEFASNVDVQDVFKNYENEKTKQEAEKAKNDYYRKYRRWPGQARPKPRETEPKKEYYRPKDVKKARIVSLILAILVSLIIIDGLLPEHNSLEKITFLKYEIQNRQYQGTLKTTNYKVYFSTEDIPHAFQAGKQVVIGTTPIFRTIIRIIRDENGKILQLKPYYRLYGEFSIFLFVMLSVSYGGLFVQNDNKLTVDLTLMSIIVFITSFIIYIITR